MFTTTLVGLMLAVGQAPDAGTLFAPDSCSFAVTFPVAPEISETADNQGDQTKAADFVGDGARYSAACIRAASDRSDATLSEPDAASTIEQMAKSLGVRDESLQPSARLGNGCEEIDGALGPADSSYRISATICVSPKSTFIAEIVYPGASPTSPERTFLNSISAR